MFPSLWNNSPAQPPLSKAAHRCVTSVGHSPVLAGGGDEVTTPESCCEGEVSEVT